MTTSTARRSIASGFVEYISDEVRQLRILRRLWWPAFITFVVIFAISVPVFFDQVKTACDVADCLPLQRNAQPPGTSPSLHFYAGFAAIRESVTFLFFCIIALFLAVRGRNDRMALFTALVLVSFAGGVIPETLYALSVTGFFWRIIASFLGILGSGAMLLYFCLFPNGYVAPRWTRWVVAGGTAFSIFTYAVPSTSSLNSYSDTSVLIFFILLTILAFGQWQRYRSISTPVERQQTKWMVFGFGTSLAGFFVSALVLPMIGPDIIANRTMFRLVGQTIASGFIILVPIAIALGTMKYRLWDIDLFINRALSYGSLSVIVVGIYVGVVTLLGTLVPASGDTLISLVATGFLAVLFQPLRIRLQRAVNRLLYGERDDPYGVLSRLGDRLGAAIDQREVLPTIVETVTQSLRVPYAAIVLAQPDLPVPAISSGRLSGTPQVWPLLFQQERVGELHVSTRGPGESFSSSDQRLLDDLAHQAGTAIHAVRLSTELQRSRERIVMAREEERKRLRRDLHDGLGPQLASQTLTLDAARKLMPSNPMAADHLLDELRSHIQTSVADIRKLVYALRPPVLDELGLIGAIGESVHRLHGGAIQFSLETPVTIGALPAAVEVAVLRIAQEAITNVVKHSGASRCTVRVSRNQEAWELLIEIEDDGRGISPDREVGVGLISMRERASELGGRCVIEAIAGGGTLVHASIPLGDDA